MKILWTDGSASPNPGPGGFAVIYDASCARVFGWRGGGDSFRF